MPEPIKRRRAALHRLLPSAYCLLLLPGAAQAADLAEVQSQYNSGHYPEAAQAAGKALADGEFDEGWDLLKIRAELACGAYAEARASFETALQKHPTSLALRLLGRDAYLRTNEPQLAEQQLTAIQSLAEQSPWRYSDAAGKVLLGRTLLLGGAEPRQVLELLYDKARTERPDEVDAYIASSELALDKGDDALAAKSLAKALELTPQDPYVHYLLVRALASSDDQQSAAALAKALELNPRHVPSLLIEVEACLDAEDDAGAEKLLERVDQVNAREPLAGAYRAVMAHLAGDKKAEQNHRARALEPWATNPEVDHTIGRRLARKYRFAEAADYERKALTSSPRYAPAKIQLAQDLLRLGDEEEGWRLAAEATSDDGYNVVAHNLTTLHDALAKFRTLEADGFVVRMEAREAEIYGRPVLELLRSARDTLAPKYEVELKQPVIVEIFPQQKDFAARTFGLPGGIGYLGVCFGRVITANSPASQADHPANWQAVLWHEFCHVITLTKTRNKMPRWLSEGISVYEERQQNPTWGQALDPTSRKMILSDDLTPVSRLSGAFLKPASSQHLQFAYFESSLVVEYLVEHYGQVALKRILVDLANDVPVNQALARHTEKLDQLDADFAAFARKKAEALAPQADWSPLELADDAELTAVVAWNHEHPHHAAGLEREIRLRLAAKQWAETKPPLESLAAIDPKQAYPLLARVHRELHETVAERAALEKVAALENDAVDAYLRLIELAIEAKDWAAVERNARRILAVNPLIVAPYRHLAGAAEVLAHPAEAIHARQVLLVLDDSDPAEAHYRLSKLFYQQKQLLAARRHVLQALEETPRFRAAQQLLLQIVERSAEPSKDKSSRDKEEVTP